MKKIIVTILVACSASLFANDFTNSTKRSKPIPEKPKTTTERVYAVLPKKLEVEEPDRVNSKFI